MSADGDRQRMERLPASLYPKPLIFHDGRLVAKPTPANVLMLILWLPFGIILAATRLAIGLLLPYKLILLCAAATGLRISADVSEQLPVDGKEKGTGGRLYVCSHRTLLDPVMISCSLQRRVMAVTYSLSRLSELISPIPNFRLSRDRVKDGEMMRSLLERGDLVVCPEGTTCREPYLLRFSPLFAEIVDEIVPVAVTVEGVAMFYGTTVRGYKCLDSFFFLMNPMPCYRLKFLKKVRSRKNSGCHVDVANHVQKLIGGALGFQCTNLTRRDKYRMIAGNDGVVRPPTSSIDQ